MEILLLIYLIILGNITKTSATDIAISTTKTNNL